MSVSVNLYGSLSIYGSGFPASPGLPPWMLFHTHVCFSFQTLAWARGYKYGEIWLSCHFLLLHQTDKEQLLNFCKMGSGVKLSTVQKWLKDLDPQKDWIRFETQCDNVTVISCELCANYEDKLKCLRNFSPAFVNGITNTAPKKDNLVKHSKSEMHKKAISLKHKPASLLQVII